MTVAIIAALGTIAVALIGFFTQRIQASDARAKLQKDLELLAKLDPASLEHMWLKDHIQRSIFILVEFEKGIRPINIGYPIALFVISVGSFLYFVHLANLGARITNPLAIQALATALLFYLAGIIAFVFKLTRGRYVRKVNSADDTRHAALAEFESNNGNELVTSEPLFVRILQWLISVIRRSKSRQFPLH